jgi:hypothetical protein
MKKQEFLKQYQTKEWYEISKRIKARDNNTCQMCGCKDKPLNVHHLYYGEDGSIFVDDNSLITICEDCHKHLHMDKECIDGLIDEIKSCFTSTEIRCILEDVLEKYNTFSTLHPKTIPYSSIGQKSFLNNLKKWRVRISTKDFAIRLLGKYYYNLYYKRDVSYIKSVFQKEIGISIEKYIIQNKGICEKIERNIIDSQSKVKTKEIPF